MVIWSSIMTGLNAIDSLTNHKASKFLMKNGAKLVGSGIHKFNNAIGKPQWNKSISDKIGKAAEVLSNGKADNVITENLKTLSNETNGIKTQWKSIDDDNNTTALANIQPPPQFYNRNLGGSNFKRFKVKRPRAGRVLLPSRKFLKKHKLKRL